MMLNIDQITLAIEDTTGIKVDARLERLPDQELIYVRPHGFAVNRGIRIETSLKWRTLSSSLVFEDYAQGVVDHIVSKMERVDVFRDIIESYKEAVEKREVSYEVEDSGSIKLSIEESPIDVSVEPAEGHIANQCIDILSAVLVFFDVAEENTSDKGLPEGARMTVEVNKYERSRLNRSACINHYSPICQACNFNFEDVYGEIGKGFIHVHHITPVSELGPHYVINPIKDLVPLCPNCHAMVHRRTPPIDHNDLKQLIMDHERST